MIRKTDVALSTLIVSLSFALLRGEYGTHGTARNASAAKKSSRIASEGLVEAYIHANGKIGVLLEVNCETDFVALNDGFKGVVRDLCMHIAAAAPEYVSRDDVPEDAIEKERAVQLARTLEEGKPEQIAAKIVEGRMNKWFADVCLLEQKYVKNDEKSI